MLVEEGGEAFREVPRVLDVHEVVGVRQHERFGGGQEREQEFVSLPERRRDLVAVGPQDGQDWLGDAPRLLLAERELHQRGPLLTEERVGVPHGLVEGTGNRPLERRTIPRAEDTLQERVDGTGTVASLEPADRFAGVGSARRECLQRRLKQRNRDDDLRRVERELQRHRPSGRVGHDVG